MGRRYSGVGYLTGRNLSFYSGVPGVRVDDDTGPLFRART
jgi:hypothetical protein